MRKIINIFNQVKFYFKKYGMKATIKKCLRKICWERGKNQEFLNYQRWISENEPNAEELEIQRNHKFLTMPFNKYRSYFITNRSFSQREIIAAKTGRKRLVLL